MYNDDALSSICLGPSVPERPPIRQPVSVLKGSTHQLKLFFGPVIFYQIYALFWIIPFQEPEEVMLYCHNDTQYRAKHGSERDQTTISSFLQ
jgi:hypothetical protein